jgi:DNA invertase Pin-like site-specific DNA recombinase
MYIRKSSESEDRQALSIPAQERELRALADRKGYVVVGAPIAESMSAKRPGRPGFAELLQRLENGEADGILCWHLDRLARNPIDGGQIMWKVGKPTLSVIAAPDREYAGTPDDKMLMSIIFGMATKYSDDLAKNVMRGTREALLRGLWPGKYKFGYMRDPDTGLMVPDPKRWSLVRQLWDWRLEGVSVQEIHRRAVQELGLTRPVSARSLRQAAVRLEEGEIDDMDEPRPLCGRQLLAGPIGRNTLYHLLSDPFYAGQMAFDGRVYKGIHKAMVTPDEFARAQFHDETPAPSAPTLLPFAYRGLIRCGTCGAAVTAERKTNRQGHKYVYYHCARRQRTDVPCRERSVTEDEIDAEMQAFLGRFRLPDAVLTAFEADVVAQLDAAAQQQVTAVDERRAELRRMDAKLERLRELLVDGVITSQDYTRDRERALAARDAVAEHAAKPPTKAELLEPVRSAVSAMKTGRLRFDQLSATKKLAVVREACSNLTLQGSKLSIHATEIVDVLLALGEDPDWFAVRDAARTYLEAHASSSGNPIAPRL